MKSTTTVFRLKLHSHATAQDHLLPTTTPSIELAREARSQAEKLFPGYAVAIIKVTNIKIESRVE